jgi:uncharacterized repeat protein (TIGR01451 family)
MDKDRDLTLKNKEKSESSPSFASSRLFGGACIIGGTLLAYLNIFLLRFDYFTLMRENDAKYGDGEIAAFVAIGIPVGALLILYGIFLIVSNSKLNDGFDNLISWAFEPEPSKPGKGIGRILLSLPLLLIGLPFGIALFLGVVGIFIVAIRINFVRIILLRVPLIPYAWWVELSIYIIGFGILAVGLHLFNSGNAMRTLNRSSENAEQKQSYDGGFDALFSELEATGSRNSENNKKLNEELTDKTATKESARAAAIGLTNAVAPHNEIADAVNKFTGTEWYGYIEAKPGQTVDFLIDYRNAGTSSNLNVLFKDTLPKGFTYVPGSGKYIMYKATGEIYKSGSWANTDSKNEAVYNVTTHGVSVSGATSGFAPTTYDHSYILMFSAKIDDDIKLTNGSNRLTNIAYVSADVDGKRFYNSNTAYVSIVKENSNTEEFQTTLTTAQSGDADAQNSLGVCYYQGRGVAKDYTQAIEWFQKAATQGHAGAQCNLGICYDNGYGVVKDYTKAVEWYQKAAMQGYTIAQYNLGVCYQETKDYTKAAEWFQKAAIQGHDRAQYNLGICYYKGSGVTKDHNKAIEWLKKAAMQGHAGAQQVLAQIGQRF